MAHHIQACLEPWQLRINSKRCVDVYIWPSLSTLRNHVWQDSPEDLRACYRRRADRASTDEIFGELHFIYDCMDLGTVAHEIQHVVMDYAQHRDWDIVADTERFCDLTGLLTTAFWKRYNDQARQVCTDGLVQE